MAGIQFDSILQCNICYENYNTTTHRPKIAVPCGHGMCSDCAPRIITKGCPECRREGLIFIPNYDLERRISEIAQCISLAEGRLQEAPLFVLPSRVKFAENYQGSCDLRKVDPSAVFARQLSACLKKTPAALPPIFTDLPPRKRPRLEFQRPSLAFERSRPLFANRLNQREREPVGRRIYSANRTLPQLNFSSRVPVGTRWPREY